MPRPTLDRDPSYQAYRRRNQAIYDRCTCDSQDVQNQRYLDNIRAAHPPRTRANGSGEDALRRINDANHKFWHGEDAEAPATSLDPADWEDEAVPAPPPTLPLKRHPNLPEDKPTHDMDKVVMQHDFGATGGLPSQSPPNKVHKDEKGDLGVDPRSESAKGNKVSAAPRGEAPAGGKSANEGGAQMPNWDAAMDAAKLRKLNQANKRFWSRLK